MFELRRFGSISPCNGICTYDKNDQYCIGCYRTNEEISAWNSLDEKKRQKILHELPIRAVGLKKSNKRFF